MKEKKRGGKLAVFLGALTAAAAAGAAVGAVLLRRKKENIHISEADLADTLPIPQEDGAAPEEEADDVCGCFDGAQAPADAPDPEDGVTPEEEEKICQPEEE